MLGAGVTGGQVVYSGSVAGMKRSAQSLTGKYLSGKLAIPVPTARAREVVPLKPITVQRAERWLARIEAKDATTKLFVDSAKRTLARLGAKTSGMDADRVIFTSGGTEANNLVVLEDPTGTATTAFRAHCIRRLNWVALTAESLGGMIAGGTRRRAVEAVKTNLL